ncbi:MAG: hypothetical protein WHT09_10810 [Thermogutta sp.]
MENTLVKKVLASSLLFVWIIPTLVICTSAWMSRTASSTLPFADRLALLFGTNVQIGSVERPRPGVLRLKNVCLIDPCTRISAFQASTLTVTSHSEEEIWLVDQAVMTCDGLNLLRQALEYRIFTLTGRRRISVSCQELVLHDGKSQHAPHGARSETNLQIPSTAVWRGRLEAECDPTASTLHVRLFDKSGSARVADAPPRGSAESPDSQSMPALATALLEWSLLGTREGISEHLAVNAPLPFFLVEPWLPIAMERAQVYWQPKERGGTFALAGPTVGFALGGLFQLKESSFFGNIVSSGTLVAPGRIQWHVAVAGQSAWRDASPGISGILGGIPHQSGRLDILRLEAIDDRLIFADYLIHLETGWLRTDQAITTGALLERWFATPGSLEENVFWPGRSLFSEYGAPGSSEDGYQVTERPAAGFFPFIDEEQLFGEDGTEKLSVRDGTPFDSFDLRVIWDADGIRLLPSAESDSSWIVARWQGLPVLALNGEALGSRIPWGWVLQQAMTRSGEPGSSWGR